MSLVHLNKKKINSWAFKYLLIQERRLINTRRGWYMCMFIRLVKCPVSGEELRKQRIAGFVGKIELLNLNIVE